MGISSRLKQSRKQKGYTQASIAARLGIPVGTYRNWEQGISSPDNDKIVEIIQLLETTSDYLFGMTDVMQNGRSNEITRQSLKDDEKILLDAYKELGDAERGRCQRFAANESLYKPQKKNH